MKKGVDYIGVGVGAAIFDENGRLFITQRGKAARNERGQWEIPGGGVELGETFEQSIVREMKEEHGIEIEVLELLGVCDHIIPDEGQHWVSPTYICRIVRGEPRLVEPEKCEQFGWFTIEEAEKLPLSIVTKYDISLLKKKYLKGVRVKSFKKSSKSKALKNKKVITICSSASFYKDVLVIEKELKKMGYRVKIPSVANKMKKSGNYDVSFYKTWFKNPNDYKNKTKLMNDHFKKILEADAILIVNGEKNGVPGYIGGNGLMEMGLAYHYKKPVFVFNKVSDKSNFVEEVFGMGAVIIDGDLSKIRI